MKGVAKTAASVTVSILLSQSCSLLEIPTINSCRNLLKKALKDPDSYREIVEPRKVQDYRGNPPVFGWQFNAKNSFGGYGDPNMALCYWPRGGKEVVVSFFRLSDSEGRRNFLALTNPKIRNEIEEEKAELERRNQEAKARSAADNIKREKSFAEIARFCDHWLKGVKNANDGRYSWSQPILRRYGIRSRREINMDPLSSICLAYGMNKESEKYYEGQPRWLAYEGTYSVIPEWEMHRNNVCKVDPDFCR